MKPDQVYVIDWVTEVEIGVCVLLGGGHFAIETKDFIYVEWRSRSTKQMAINWRALKERVR